MKRVAEQDMCTDIADFIRRKGLDGAIGAHWHKGRSLHLAMDEAYSAAPRGTVLLVKDKFHDD